MNIAQSVMDEEKAINGESKQHLKLLMTIGRRMSYLLNDLIDVTRMEQKGIPIHKRPVDLQPIITMVIDMQKFIGEEKKLQIIANIPERFPFVLADQNRLIQILFNLLHNAVKFTDEGAITIDVEKRKITRLFRLQILVLELIKKRKSESSFHMNKVVIHMVKVEDLDLG